MALVSQQKAGCPLWASGCLPAPRGPSSSLPASLEVKPTPGTLGSEDGHPQRGTCVSSLKSLRQPAGTQPFGRCRGSSRVGLPLLRPLPPLRLPGAPAFRGGPLRGQNHPKAFHQVDSAAGRIEAPVVCLKPRGQPGGCAIHGLMLQ